MCEYFFENKITFKKHINTKYEVHNCDKCSAQFKTSMKLIKHMAKWQESGKKDNLYRNELSFNCKTKKTL